MRTRAEVAPSARRVALRVALTYAALATLWILGSGYLAGLLPVSLVARVELLKGIFFVGVTALLLWATVLGWANRYAAQLDVVASTQRKMHQVIHSLPVGVVLTEDDGRITLLNPAAERMLGTTDAGAVGAMLTDVAKLLDTSLAELDDLIRGGRADGLEIRGLDPAGSHALIARAATLEPQDVGEGTMVVSLTDVTDCHHETDRVTRLANGYRLLSRTVHLVGAAHDRTNLFESVCAAAVTDGDFAAAGVVAKDVEGSVSTIASSGFVADVILSLEGLMTGQGRQSDRVRELLGGGELLVSNDVSVESAGPFQALSEFGFGSGVAFEIACPEDSPVFMMMLATDIAFFDQEQIRLVQTLREVIELALEKLDIDDRRLKTEGSLVRSEAAYQDIFEKHPEPMWVYDRATLRFLAVNNAAIRKYGYSREEFESMTIVDIRPAEDLPRLLRAVAHHALGREESGFWTHIDKAGRAFTVDTHTNSVSWQGVDAQLVLVQEIATVE